MTQPPDNQGLGQPRYDDPLSPGTPVPGSVADAGGVEPVDYPVGTGVGATAAGGSSSGTGSTADVAKEQAADVKDSAKEKGQHVAEVAKDQAANVTGEAQRQAKDLLEQGRTELRSQTRQQQQRAASGLHTLADELLGMAEGRNEAPGVVADLARDASGRLKSFASQLDNREPAELLDDLRRFARQRPGAFLGLAAVAGVLAGRLTRGVRDASTGGGGTGTPVAGAYGTGTHGTTAGTGTYGTDTYGTDTYGTSASGGDYTGTAPVGDYGTTTSTGYGTGTTGVPGSAGDTTPFGDPEAYDVPGRSGGTYPTTGGTSS